MNQLNLSKRNIPVRDMIQGNQLSIEPLEVSLFKFHKFISPTSWFMVPTTAQHCDVAASGDIPTPQVLPAPDLAADDSGRSNSVNVT